MAALQVAPIVLSASKLMDLDTMLRDSRCARALRVSRLEQLRFEPSSESHVLSPVSGDKCLLCAPHAKQDGAEAESLSETVPSAESTAAPGKSALTDSQATEDTVEDETDVVPAIEEEASLYPEPAMIEAAEARKAGEELEDESKVPAKGETLSADSSKPVSCSQTRVRISTCKHFKTKFNSTCNSKRRVQTMLFWKRHLGIAFPVTDDMLRDHVWKNLESCSYGIKRSNGHAKHARGGVCINPYHYFPVDYSPLLTTLIDGLQSLGLISNNHTLANLVAMRSVTADDKLLFETMCRYIQCAPINISNPMVSMPTGPTLDSRVPTLVQHTPPVRPHLPQHHQQHQQQRLGGFQLVPTMTPAMAAALAPPAMPTPLSMSSMPMFASQPMPSAYSPAMHAGPFGAPLGHSMPNARALYYYQPGTVPGMRAISTAHLVPTMGGNSTAHLVPTMSGKPAYVVGPSMG